MPKISVIMLTYNRENYLKRAVEAILAQTFQDFELILVDNGSTDHSGEICDMFQEKDKRIKAIHIEKSNIGTGRNKGLDIAEGEYIAFADDDDVAEKDFLETLYVNAIENAADISICGAYIDEENSVTPYGVFEDTRIMTPEEAVVNLMWRKMYNNAFPTKLITKKIFESNRFLDETKYEDIHVMYKVLANANKVVAFGKPKYHFTRHASNNSGVTRKDWMITPEYLAEYRGAYQTRTDWLCRRFPNYSEYWKYFNWSFQISMVNKILSNGILNCEKHLQEMKKDLYENRESFLKSPYVLDFEKSWMEEYINGR